MKTNICITLEKVNNKLISCLSIKTVIFAENIWRRKISIYYFFYLYTGNVIAYLGGIVILAKQKM